VIAQEIKSSISLAYQGLMLDYIIIVSDFFHKNRRLHLAHLRGSGECTMKAYARYVVGLVMSEEYNETADI